MKDLGYSQNWIELKKLILKYNELWFEIVYNERELQEQLIELQKAIGYYLFKVNLSFYDLTFVGKIIEYKSYHFQKIESIHKHFGSIERVNDFRV